MGPNDLRSVAMPLSNSYRSLKMKGNPGPRGILIEIEKCPVEEGSSSKEGQAEILKVFLRERLISSGKPCIRTEHLTIGVYLVD